MVYLGDKSKDGSRKSMDADDDATSVMSYESSNVSIHEFLLKSC